MRRLDDAAAQGEERESGESEGSATQRSLRLNSTTRDNYGLSRIAPSLEEQQAGRGGDDAPALSVELLEAALPLLYAHDSTVEDQRLSHACHVAQLWLPSKENAAVRLLVRAAASLFV